MPIGITYEQVAHAADELIQERKYPTNATVREKLGNTGSFSTIGKHLAQWKTTRLLADHEKPLLPENANDPLSHAVNHVWVELEKKSQAKIDHIQQLLETQVSHYKNEFEKTDQEKAFALEQVHTLTEERRRLLAENHGLQQQLQHNERDHLKLDTQFTEAQHFHQQEKQAYENQLKTLTNLYEKNVADLNSQIQKQDNMLSEAKDYQETYRQTTSVEIENLKVHYHQLEMRYTQLQKDEQHNQTLLKQYQHEKSAYKTIETKIHQLTEKIEEKKHEQQQHLSAFQIDLQTAVDQSHQALLSEITASFSHITSVYEKPLHQLEQTQHTVTQQLERILDLLQKAQHITSGARGT